MESLIVFLLSHMHVLIKGGYFSGRQPSRLIRAAILDLCGDLKNDAVALVDVFAPPDFILNSPIGCADGEVSYLKRPKGDCEQLHGSFDSKDESRRDPSCFQIPSSSRCP